SSACGYWDPMLKALSDENMVLSLHIGAVRDGIARFVDALVVADPPHQVSDPRGGIGQVVHTIALHEGATGEGLGSERPRSGELGVAGERLGAEGGLGVEPGFVDVPTDHHGGVQL